MAKTKKTNNALSLSPSPISTLNTNTEHQSQEPITQKHYFATSQIYAESMNYKPISRPYTKEQVEKALKNPLKNYHALQQVSNYLYAVSPSYQNTIDHMANILAFDYVLTPTDYTDKKTTMMNRLLSASKKAKQSQVKTVFPKMLERTLVQGETYWYTLTDNENTIYIEIPAKFCEVYEIDSNNLFRYKIRLDLLNADIVKSLPEEIKNAYNTFHENKNKKIGKRDKNDAMDSLKYKVSEKGFAILTHGLLSIHDYPYYANSFIDLLQLEEDKEYLNSNIRDDNIKMVHNKIKTDDSGVPLLPQDVIRNYHETDKKHVPRNVSVSTTPFDKQAISFDNSNKSQINLVEQSKKNVPFPGKHSAKRHAW